MSVDVVTEMTKLWSKLRKGLDALDANSSEKKVNAYLEQYVVMVGAEAQAVYTGLEELDDEAATDKALTNARRRAAKVQKTMEKLSFPLSEKAWGAFRDAVADHLDKSPKDIGVRLSALSKADRAEIGASVKVWLQK